LGNKTVRKDPALIICLLLLVSSPQIGAQDDINDEDLQALLNEQSEINEVDEGITETPDITISPQEGKQAVDIIEEGSTDTVDLNSLDTRDDPSALGTPVEPEAVPIPDEADDMDTFKADTQEVEAITPATPEAERPVVKKAEPAVFDVGREERQLVVLSQNIQGQITDNEWNEVATTAKVDSYTVVKDDWLFKISKRLFGTGFYYPKIWSLNSYITNPHFIEPGMMLSFTTGSGVAAPEIKLGTFTADELEAIPGSLGTDNATELANFGDDAKPAWVNEKSELSEQGVYFQYASEETMDDLVAAGEMVLNREYEHYEPPRQDFELVMPSHYDELGFDQRSRVHYSVKEGFYLSTFVSTNIVQDFGSLTDGPNENIYFVRGDTAYVKFEESMKVLPGDRFSVYTSGGKARHANSDREGYKYSIVGQIKLIRQIRDKWEVEFLEVSGTPQRGDRVTVYTPKIERITRTFNSRMVEAAILASYQPNQSNLSFGDVIYLDRGRADGLEMGNVLEIYGFKDRFTKRNITDQPTYKTGEVTVITLTDNFATALITNSRKDFYTGDIAITKTKEAHLREMKARDARAFGQKEMMGGKALDELDVELNLENLNEDLLKQADKIQLTEDELAELERQEREKSVIRDSERDLKALERLESEIEQAESILQDARLDEDKLLERENLDAIEKKRGTVDQDSLNEIEENLGKRYIDEDMNAKENPYGLSEFDIEEVDELLNIEKGQ
jgi:hypothetical protein